MPRKVRKHLIFPEELANEVAEAARRGYRDFTAEVILRCAYYAHNAPTIRPQQSHDVGVTKQGDVTDAPTVVTQHAHDSHTTVTQQSHNTPTIVTSDDEEEDEPETPSDRATLLDMLLADGEPTNRTSNFQVRRRKQMEFLKEQWSVMFPDNPPLTDTHAKQFLSWSGEKSADVLAAMEVAAGRGVKGNGLLGYVTKVVKSNTEKAKQPARAEKQSDTKYPWDSEPVLREPTPEELAEMDHWAEVGRRLWGEEGSGNNT